MWLKKILLGGGDGHSLLCSESMLSSSPPVSSSPQQSPTETELRQVWRHPEGSPHGPKSYTPSQLSQGTVAKSPSSPRITMHADAPLGREYVRTPTKLKSGERNNECLPPKKREIISPAKEMDSQKVAAEEERMRSMPGVVTVSVPTTYTPVLGTENPLNRLADVAINSERHLTSAPLAPSTATLEARNMTHLSGEIAPVSYPTAPYSSIYSSASIPSAKPSSSLIPSTATIAPGSGPVTALPTSGPYVAAPYLGQYGSAGGYLPSAFGQYPQIESYSAMLATMGNHIQQAQGQGNKPPLVPSQLGMSRQLDPNTSVGTSSQPQLYMAQEANPEQPPVPTSKQSPDGLDRKNGVPMTHAGTAEVLIPTSNMRNILAVQTASQKLSLGVQASSGVGETVLSPNNVKTSVSDDDVFKKPGAVVTHGRVAPPGAGSGIAVSMRPLGGRMDNALPCELPSWPNIILPQAIGTQASAVQYLDTFSATSLPHLSSTNTVHPIPSTVPHLAIPPGATLAPIPPPAPSAIALSHGGQVLGHFMKGSVIQLAGGDLKRVEDVKTEDFLQMSGPSSPHHVTTSTVVRITMEDGSSTGLVHITFAVGHEKNLVTVESTVDHPFFVVGQGWSSCRPERTLSRYSLQCHTLTVGDTCVSLTLSNSMNGLSQESGRAKQSTESLKERTDFTGLSTSSQNNRINRVELTSSSSSQQQQPPQDTRSSEHTDSAGSEVGTGFVLPHSEIPGNHGQHPNVGLQQSAPGGMLQTHAAATMQQSTLPHQAGLQFAHHQRNHIGAPSSSSRPGLQHGSPLIHVGVPVLPQAAANRALPQYVQVLQPGPGGYMAIPVQTCSELEGMPSSMVEENGRHAKMNSKLYMVHSQAPSSGTVAVSDSKLPNTDDNLIHRKGNHDDTSAQTQKIRKRRWSAPETGDREEDAASPSRQVRSVALESLIKFTSQKQGS
ncbi:ataxin-1-like isoform X2 [Branchiostoma floridae]|uniref:Ataxin-1-like isoform X2 n=1 Tax=Branchiostoma floridae TaxID=7739 RepID=A0A9J7LCD3_BRAFL|nr:ataxin-1-like isoform X2 [Branchiostoma floridae]